MAKFQVITNDDWAALFVDGELVNQGHSISLKELAEAAGLDFNEREAKENGQAYLDDHGYFPDTLTEFEEAEKDY